MVTDPRPENENQPQADVTIDEILRRVDALPHIDKRSPEEVIGYDPNGLPASNVACTELASPTREQTENESDFMELFLANQNPILKRKRLLVAGRQSHRGFYQL